VQHKVRMSISQKRFRELLDRYLTNTATPEEKAILERFFKSYQSGLLETENESNPHLEKELLRGIHARIHSKHKKRKKRVIRLWLSLAAALALFVLAFFLTDIRFADTQKPTCGVIEVNTTVGQRSVGRLPDGSTVYLNSDSKISYCEGFAENIREVSVSGEAYFEVVKNGKPFVVRSPGMRTEVLGTSFNVKNRGGDNAEVTLVEGSVNVVSAGATSLLKPNQQAVIELTSGAISIHEINILPYTSWKDNTLFFERTSLKEAVAILESWYVVRIDILNPALAQCTITAKYQDQPLGNVLGSLQFLLALDIIRLNDGHYTINGKGCKRK
jgi:transmembrane sensor